jgi:hypothetical protein
MSKSKETSFEKAFQLPNPGLWSYFDRVRKGQDQEYRTPFAEGSSVTKVLGDWASTLNRISHRWPTLVDFENDLKAKVGPMSIQLPLEQRMEDIDHYYEDILLSSTPVSDSALRAVIKEFSAIRGLRVRSQQKTIELMEKSKNSGSPYFTHKRDVVDITKFCDVRGCDQYLGFPTDPHVTFCQPKTTWKYAAVLGWRGQEGGPRREDVKQRVVWMFPFSVNIRELQVYQPLIESCQNFNLVPAWVSMEAVDERITHMFDTKRVDDAVICTDFSKFDQHFNATLQDAAQSILEFILTPDYDSLYWFHDIFPIKYNIPLAYDFGKIRFGKHGMGSGSGGTNADETLAHRALQYEAAINHGARLNLYSQCLGDDGVLTYPGIRVEDVVESYSSHGQEMNLDKQHVSNVDCVYLRRWHHKDYRVGGVCVGVYSTYRALGRLCEQERFYDPAKWSKEMVALRQLSIIENVKYHPLRAEFAEFCMKRDKYRLGLDIPGFLENIESITAEATEYMPDFMGYTKSLGRTELGISNWWIVKYLKSKR